MMAKHRARQRGFTLEEVAISVIIIAILAAILIPTMNAEFRATRYARVKADVSGIAKAIARMRRDTGVVAPACLTDLTNLLSATLTTNCTNLNVTSMTYCSSSPVGKACWGGPYLPSIDNDPWEEPYQAFTDTTTWAVTVVSRGPNLILNDFDDITYTQ